MAAAAAIPPHGNIAAAGKDQGARTGPKAGAEKQKASQNSRQKEMSVLLPWESSLEKKDGVCAQSMSYSTPNLPAKLGN